MLFQACKNMPILQHLAIFFTTFVSPVAFDLLDGWSATGLCPSCVNGGRLAVYVGMWLFAMVVIALATRDDETKIAKKLRRINSVLEGSIHELREESEGKIVGVQDRVDALDNLVADLRQTLKDELGIRIHHRVSARSANWNFDLPAPSVTHTPAVPRNKIARFFLRAKRQCLRLWGKFYILVVDDREKPSP